MLRRAMLTNKRYKFYIICIDLINESEKEHFAKLKWDNNKPYLLMNNVYSWKVSSSTTSKMIEEFLSNILVRATQFIVFEKPDEMSWKLPPLINEFIELNLRDNE